MADYSRRDAARALLLWYKDMGVDEAVGSSPADFYAAPAMRAPSSNSAPRPALRAAPAAAITPAEAAMPADEAARQAAELARGATTFEALADAVAAFDGCPLKAGARTTVFTDGVPGASLLVIGEAPGRDEDRLGKPFVGRAGQLLDRMLAAIGRSRVKDTLISNVVYWRPPGNREPTQIEIAICRPFVDRLIELTNPRAIVLAGAAPTRALLGLNGIMRARGVWRDIETSSGAKFPALPIFHPAFLLRQPAQKRLAWSDLLALEARLTDD
ncbi:MAG: uracil-DNA glycosylase [Parvularculaceae bacterium]